MKTMYELNKLHGTIKAVEMDDNDTGKIKEKISNGVIQFCESLEVAKKIYINHQNREIEYLKTKLINAENQLKLFVESV